VPTTWSIVGQRDFDSDSHFDLLWRDTSGNTAIWFLTRAWNESFVDGIAEVNIGRTAAGQIARRGTRQKIEPRIYRGQNCDVWRQELRAGSYLLRHCSIGATVWTVPDLEHMVMALEGGSG
jgi:hypothetical protein